MAAAIRDRIKESEPITKADLDRALAGLEARMVKWFAGMMIVQIGVIIGILKALD